MVATLLVAAWGYVVFVDTRPDQGGGATFAVFIGWFGCALASAIAIIANLIRPNLRADRAPGNERPAPPDG